tara:strand:- start:414 stop:608 length:195 start_codon:yes stop_codon:yes gene_type:complete
VVVGDLIEVTNSQTTGINDGEVGIITKIEHVSRQVTIYWVDLGNYGMQTPFWDNEIRLLSGKDK